MGRVAGPEVAIELPVAKKHQQKVIVHLKVIACDEGHNVLVVESLDSLAIRQQQ